MALLFVTMIKDQRDFWAGVLFAICGAFFSLYSMSHYTMGSAARMGPGYFPALLGGFLCFLGLCISAKTFFFASTEDDGGKVGSFDWFSLIVILTSVAFFAVLLRPMGLIVAVVVMIGTASIANRAFKWKEVIALCSVLAFLTWLVFVVGINLVVPIWPKFLGE